MDKEKGVLIVPFKKEVIPEDGESLLSLLKRAGAYLESPCGGRGICGKCMVNVRKKGEKGFKSLLACRTPAQGGMEVEEFFAQEAMEIVEEGLKAELEINPPFELYSKVFKGKIPEKPCGIAIDIGTTTVVLSLLDMNRGEEKGRISFQNPQTFYGADVMTRISYCMENEGGTEELRNILLKRINEAIFGLTGGKAENVILVAVTGNPAMLHIFLGLNPSPLGTAPYKTLFNGDEVVNAGDAGIALKNAALYIPPFPSAYIGADITAGVSLTEISLLREDAIYVDMGTNAEVLLKKSDGTILASSAAAGPVFEGYRITCGMRATKGAIYDVIIKKGEVKVRTIGETIPIGICGSGLLNAVAEFLRTGIIDRTGKFGEGVKEYREFYDGDEKHFYLSRGEREVFISQSDIREFQLARSAIRTGIEILIKESSVSPANLKHLYIAGGFGRGITLDNLKRCGIIPEIEGLKMSYLGNASIEGAKAILLSKPCLERVRELRERILTLNLPDYPSFQEMFISYLNF